MALFEQRKYTFKASLGWGALLAALIEFLRALLGALTGG